MEQLSAVLLLQRILDEALERGCTDVHVYCDRTGLVVKFRKDGQLSTYLHADRSASDVIRRIKALARLDVAEFRVPQDGSFHWESEVMQCEVRVATLPTIHGEAVVLRLFPQQRAPIDFHSLGMNAVECQALVNLLRVPSGLVLVSGPTNSGKTTTLYAMMMHLARLGRKVVSIEDPVEVPIDECQQMEVREQIGITFERGLRALLRHDPDVIMIGEIRDDSVAHAAVRASLSGHLVLSTVHADDFVGAMLRMVGFGIPRALLADVVKGAVSQRFTGALRDAGNEPQRPVFHIMRTQPAVSEMVAGETPWWQIRERTGPRSLWSEGGSR